LVAAPWFVLFAADPRRGLLFLLGAALAPAQALALLPVLVLGARGPLRRGCLAAGAVLAATAVAGLAHSPLPFTGEPPPVTLGLAGSPYPGQAFAAVGAVLAQHPALWIEAAVLFAATIAAPHVSRWGLWGVAGWGAAFLAATLLAPAGAVSAWPTALWVWIAAAVLAGPMLRMRG
jgi:hypothetical protein